MTTDQPLCMWCFMSNYPAAAIKVTFRPLQGGQHNYRIWESGGKWFWYSMGNSGVEATQEAAMWQARNWIRDGVKSRTKVVSNGG